MCLHRWFGSTQQLDNCSCHLGEVNFDQIESILSHTSTGAHYELHLSSFVRSHLNIGPSCATLRQPSIQRIRDATRWCRCIPKGFRDTAIIGNDRPDQVAWSANDCGWWVLIPLSRTDAAAGLRFMARDCTMPLWESNLFIMYLLR